MPPTLTATEINEPDTSGSSEESHENEQSSSQNISAAQTLLNLAVLKLTLFFCNSALSQQ